MSRKEFYSVICGLVSMLLGLWMTWELGVGQMRMAREAERNSMILEIAQKQIDGNEARIEGINARLNAWVIARKIEPVPEADTEQ